MILDRLIVKIDSDLSGLRDIGTGMKGLEHGVLLSTDRMTGGIRGLETGLDRLRMGLTKNRSSMALFAGATGAGLATKAVFDLGAAVGETASKFKTVFGPETDRLSGFIREFGVMAGLSNREAQDLLATTGAIGQGMGLSGRAAADFSIDLTRLAGDLSSFNNIPIAETSLAIQAAVTGEREQLKRYGIVINEADVTKRALLDTGKRTAAQLTQEEKAYATLALVTQRAGVAVGDLARTKESAANQARALRAEIQNIKESIAVSLLPALGAGVQGLNAFIKGLQIMGAEAAVSVAKIELAFAKLHEGKGGPLVDILGLGEGAGLMDPLGLDLFSKAIGADLTLSVDQAEANLARISAAAEEVKLDVVGLTNGLAGLAGGFDASGSAAAAAAGAIRELTKAQKGLLAIGAGVTAPKLPPGLGTPEALAKWKGGQANSDRLLPFGPTLTPQTAAPRAGFGSEGANAVKDFFKDLKGDLGDTFDRFFDPKQIASGLATGLLSGGLSALMGGAMSAFSSLFGPDKVDAERNRILESNTKALGALTGSLKTQESVFRALSGRDIAGGRVALGPGTFTSDGKVRTPVLQAQLERYGLTMKDLERIAGELNIEWNNSADTLRTIGKALDALDFQGIFAQFGSGFSLMQQEFNLLDITDPMEKFNRTIDLMSGLVAPDFAEQLQGLNADNIDAFLADLFERIHAGDTSLLAQLGDLTFDQLLQGLGSAEGALDELAGATNKATSAMRNVPAGFKVDLLRYRATEALVSSITTTSTATSGSRSGGFTTASARSADGGLGGTVVNVEQLIVQGVQDPKAFLEKIEQEVQWKIRSGSGGVVTSRTVRG